MTDDDDVIVDIPTLGDDVRRPTLENDDVLRAIKDPIEGEFFEGDISGVRIVAKSDVDEHNATIKNAIINTYQVSNSSYDFFEILFYS